MSDSATLNGPVIRERNILDMAALTDRSPLDRRLMSIANEISALTLAGELDRLPCDTRRLIETLPLTLLDCSADARSMQEALAGRRPWWRRALAGARS